MDHTFYVVSRDGNYIVSVPYPGSDFIRWSVSKWDAFKFNDYAAARAVADKVRGRVDRFNTITGVIS